MVQEEEEELKRCDISFYRTGIYVAPGKCLKYNFTHRFCTPPGITIFAGGYEFNADSRFCPVS